MADLYITYGLRETLWVTKLVKLLEAEGYTVCWEHAVAPGNDVRTDDSIRALNQAKCVVAVWSDTAVDDHWVLSDAERAVSQNKLLSVVAKLTIVPRAFRGSEALFLHNWKDHNVEDEGYINLMSALAKMATPSQPPKADQEQEKQARLARRKAESERKAQEQQAREARAKQRRASA